MYGPETPGSAPETATAPPGFTATSTDPRRVDAETIRHIDETTKRPAETALSDH